MAELVSSDHERPAIQGPGRQEQLRLDAPPAPVAAPAPPAARPSQVPRRPDQGGSSARPDPAGHTTRPGGELTLDELLVVAWEGVTAHHQASCPVCHGAMVPRYAAAGPESLGGSCRDCRSTLA